MKLSCSQDTPSGASYKVSALKSQLRYPRIASSRLGNLLLGMKTPMERVAPSPEAVSPRQSNETVNSISRIPTRAGCRTISWTSRSSSSLNFRNPWNSGGAERAVEKSGTLKSQLKVRSQRRAGQRIPRLYRQNAQDREGRGSASPDKKKGQKGVAGGAAKANCRAPPV